MLENEKHHPDGRKRVGVEKAVFWGKGGRGGGFEGVLGRGV